MTTKESLTYIDMSTLVSFGLISWRSCFCYQCKSLEPLCSPNVGGGGFFTWLVFCWIGFIANTWFRHESSSRTLYSDRHKSSSLTPCSARHESSSRTLCSDRHQSNSRTPCSACHESSSRTLCSDCHESSSRTLSALIWFSVIFLLCRTPSFIHTTTKTIHLTRTITTSPSSGRRPASG